MNRNELIRAILLLSALGRFTEDQTTLRGKLKEAGNGLQHLKTLKTKFGVSVLEVGLPPRDF